MVRVEEQVKIIPEIKEKLDDMHSTITKVHEQTVKTNGRVTEIERRSIGMIIKRHPIKTAMVFAILFYLIIGDATTNEGALRTILLLFGA